MVFLKFYENNRRKILKLRKLIELSFFLKIYKNEKEEILKLNFLLSYYKIIFFFFSLNIRNRFSS